LFNQKPKIMKELIPIVLFLTIGLAYYFYLQARTKERLAAIEKGLNVMPANKKSGNGRKIIFTIGLFLVGISLGLLLGYLLAEFLAIERITAYFSMILLFGGSSLVISNLIKIKKEE
jgi:hypothetical protein